MPPLPPSLAMAPAAPLRRAVDDVQLAGWLQRSTAGDRQAFADFYDATCGLVYGLVLTVVRAPDQAGQVTQEIYLAIWRDPGALVSEQVSVLASVVALAHRHAVVAARNEGHRSPRRPPRGADIVDRGRLVLGRTVRSGRSGLTPLQQEVVVLSYLGGYTVGQVSALLGLSAATVREALTTALSRLPSTPTAPTATATSASA